MAKKIKYGAIAGLILYLISVIVLCTMKTESLPQVEMTLFGIPTDKIVHFFIFMPYPILTWLVCNRVKRSLGKKLLLAFIIFATGLIIAGGTELIQTMTEYRSGELMDFVADTLGLITGLCIVSVISYYGQKRRMK